MLLTRTAGWSKVLRFSSTASSSVARIFTTYSATPRGDARIFTTYSARDSAFQHCVHAFLRRSAQHCVHCVQHYVLEHSRNARRQCWNTVEMRTDESAGT